MTYGKLFESTYTGSMLGAGANVFAVWGYVIAHCKPGANERGVETGIVELNAPLVAALIGMALADVDAAIAYLTAPDPRSRSLQHDGRRLLHVGSFIYEVPTFPEYQKKQNPDARKEATRERVRKHRASRNGAVTPACNDGNACNATQTHTHHQSTSPAATDVEGALPKAELLASFEDLWKAYGRRCDKKASLEMWLRLKPSVDLAAEIMVKASEYAASREPKHRKHLHRWLRDRCWQDEDGGRDFNANGTTPGLFTSNGKHP